MTMKAHLSLNCFQGNERVTGGQFCILCLLCTLAGNIPPRTAHPAPTGQTPTCIHSRLGIYKPADLWEEAIGVGDAVIILCLGFHLGLATSTRKAANSTRATPFERTVQRRPC